MDDISLIAIVSRALERLLIIVAGSGCIWLGYRLFDKTLTDSGALSAQGGGFTLKMQRIAPGTFFALFGGALLAVSATQSFELTKPNALASQHPMSQADCTSCPNATPATRTASARDDSYSLRYGIGGAGWADNMTQAKKIAISITNIQNIVLSNNLSDKIDNNKGLLMDSIRVLAEYRWDIVAGLYGPDAKMKFATISGDLETNPNKINNLSKDDLDMFNNVKLIMNGN